PGAFVPYLRECGAQAATAGVLSPGRSGGAEPAQAGIRFVRGCGGEALTSTHTTLLRVRADHIAEQVLATRVALQVRVFLSLVIIQRIRPIVVVVLDKQLEGLVRVLGGPQGIAQHIWSKGTPVDR